MKIKRFMAVLLALATLCGMLVFPATAAEVSSKTAFTDIADAKTAESAELLRLLGIVNGTGAGRYEPDRTLTRAEFCKMAVELMQNGDLVPAQMNRTIFKDVPSTHWARGYINVATQGGSSGSGDDATATPGIIRGDATGNFSPDRAISYAEAVTILMRILDYSDSTVGFGSQWYDGYLSTAAAAGLTEGLALAPDAALTRGQAALLMGNLLHTPKRNAEKDYMVAVMNCSTTDEVLVFDTNAIAPDGTAGSVKVEGDKYYKTDRPAFSEDLIGRKVKLVLDKDEKVLTVEPATQGTAKVVGILSATYNTVKVSGDTELKVKPETVVWKDGEKKTYKDLYLNLTAGTQAVFQYSAAGELEYVFLRSSAKADDSTQVLKNKPSTSAEPSYKIYKNGVPATAKDLRQYDVTTFDSVNNVMYVSDMRLTGVYENVYPSPETPATITVLGCEFPVLDSAAADLRSFKIGDQLTLLLSYNGSVAGAVSTSAAKSTVVGVVDKVDKDSGEATVSPLSDIRNASGAKVQFSGKTSYTGDRATAMVGQLVTVSASQQNRLTLSKLTGAASKSALNMSTRTMGTVKLSDNVTFYERVGNSQPNLIDEDQITVTSVPASKIVYYHLDYAGKADVVLLDNATGDQFEYGFLKFIAGKVHKGEAPKPGEIALQPGDKTSPDKVTVKNANDSGNKEYVTTDRIQNDAPGGIVGSLATSSGGEQKLEALILLTAVKNVSSSNFNMDDQVVTTTDAVFPIADNVQCYNRATKSWFAVPKDGDAMDALNSARAFSDTLTIYYDKAPEEGGKVRLVIVES